MLSKIVGFRMSNSVNQKEMNLFNRLTGWWHPSGPSQILFVYNYHRIKFLRKFLSSENHKYPLQGKNILDVGCGAGFLSESLARLGGNVVGLDPNLTSYTQASNHKGDKSDLSKLKYLNKSLEEFLVESENSNKKFDIVTSMQVVEHVNEPQKFINSLSSCTNQGGLIMLSTIRRSTYSWLTHIVFAQKIFRIVPEGTHEHQKFINPSQCKKMLEDSGCTPMDVLELEINWKGELQEKSGGSNYLIIAKKNSKTQQKVL